MEATDRESLQAFLRNKSEEAFRQLVERHLPMVLGTARRMLVNEQAAEEAAQNTFALLAKKAASLTPEQSLGGWLHRAARNECLHVQRAEGRRRQREETAVAMNAIEQSGTPPELLGDLEEALEELAPEEHDALVLRYLEDRKLHEVGTELGVSEDAARMRVNRALDRLRANFEQRGISISAGALVAALTGQAAVIVPAGMGAAIATTVLTKSAAAATAGGGTVTAWLTLKSAAVVTGVVAVTGVGLVWYQQNREPPAPVEQVVVAPATQTTDPATTIASAPGTSAASSPAASPVVNAAIPTAGSEQPPTPEALRFIDEARGLIERRQFEDAIERLNAAIHLSPRYPDAYLFRGNAFEGAEKLQEALADHKKAAELRPSYKQAWFEQSRILDRLEQYDLTIRAATKAIEIDPEFWQAWLGRGRANYYLKLDEQALPDLDRAIEINPKFPDAYHYRALTHLRLYQFDEAIADRRKAAEVAPDDYVQHYRLAFTLWNQYRPAEAIAPATRAIELNPAAVGGWRVRASVLSQLGRYEEALTNFTEVVRIEPQNHHSWRERGRLLFELGRPEDALKDLNRAVQLGSGYGPNYRDRGRVLLNLGKGEQAVADFERASHLGRGRAGLSGEINYQDLRQWRGEALMQQRNPAAAIVEFTARIEQYADDNAAPRRRGAVVDEIVYDDDGTTEPSAPPDPATANARTAADLPVDEWKDRAYLWRGLAYVEAGQPAKALPDLDFWLSRHEGTVQAHYYRGRAHVGLEQWELALQDLARAVEMNPRFLGARELRGAVHFQRGEFQAALDDFVTGRKQDPNSEYLTRMIRLSAEKLGRSAAEIDALLKPPAASGEPTPKPPSLP